MFNKEFDSMFNIILDKLNNNIFGFRFIVTLEDNVFLEISYIMSNAGAVLKFIFLTKDNSVICQVFNREGLFSRLSQLNLLEVFCNEVIKWHLEEV